MFHIYCLNLMLKCSIFQCGTVGGDITLCNNHLRVQFPSTVCLNPESTGVSVDVIQGFCELKCRLRLDRLEAENEMEISVHTI